jgi:hypothetical protein
MELSEERREKEETEVRTAADAWTVTWQATLPTAVNQVYCPYRALKL